MLTPSAPGFDDPLALLRACHDRILQQCATLEAMARQLAGHGLTPELRTAATAVHRYFTTAGRHHHEDEEQDLFPLLRGDAALAELIDKLEREHALMDGLWRALEPLLAAPETISDVPAFTNQVAAFCTLQAQHIARENQELLPQAAERLPAAILAVLGARMAARRGVSF